MPQDIPGIHHVTAICGDPQRNIDFYTDVLGLRFVKKTVNHDAITTYHLYYGDRVGHPGTTLTFFAWPNGRNGATGTGQATSVAFLVPEQSFQYWQDRLDDHSVSYETAERFDDQVITFQDLDGLNVELVAVEDAVDGDPWHDSPVPEQHQIRGFHGVTLTLEMYEQTAELLEDMGFEHQGLAGKRHRYEASGDIGYAVDVVTAPNRAPATGGMGTIHHVAFRTTDVETQRAWRQHLMDNGFNVTNVIDRWYFHSIYFHEPGGVLFEIATEEPGFTRDEDETALGTTLTLPEWLEDKRDMIEAQLPDVHGPDEPEQ